MDSMQLTCAKNDDVSMLDSIDCLQRDQSGKRLIDYILEYKSVRVFSSLIEENPKRFFDNLFGNHFGGRIPLEIQYAVIDDLVYLCLVSNKVRVLEQYKITGVGPEGIKSLSHRRPVVPRVNVRLSYGYIGTLTDKCFDAIADPSLVSDETFDYLLSSYVPAQKLSNIHEEESYWVTGLSNIAGKCYETGQSERLEKTLQVIEKVNEAFCETLDRRKKSPSYNPQSKQIVDNQKVYTADNRGNPYYICGYSPILQTTFDIVLERGDYDAMDRFIAVNNVIRTSGIGVYVPSEDEKRISRANHDDSMTDTQKAVQKCIHNKILNFDELMEIEDEAAVKEALDKYPIDIKEWIYDEIEAGDWPELFRFAVDRNNRALIDSATKSDAVGFKRNYSAMCPAQNRGGNMYRGKKSFDDEVAEIKENKKTIYEEYLFKKHGLIVNYPKERFERYFENGDYELAAIFICTRLEVLFKDKYKLEGDMCEMIDEFADKQKIWPQRKDLLHAIRMYRNSIVHPTNTEDADKLKNLDVKKTVRDAIDYICSLE